jgi:tRNA G18 (ribose-2'-O)-methylase SpoU
VAHVVEVDDAADPRLADFRDLARADRRPDRPGGRGLVLAEGTVVVRRLLASPYPPRALLGVARRIEDLAPDLQGADVPAYVTDADTMAHVVGFHLNRGVLASADRAPSPDPATLIAGARRVALLEGVNDHENLGALFRNAAALGVDAVLVGPDCADPLYRRSVRVSMGHVLRVPFATCALAPAVEALRGAGRQGGDPTVLGDLAGHERLALVLGAEGPGLSDEALAAADVRVRIPMSGDVDSLNVATAAAVAFHATGLLR